MPYITSANIACGFHAGDPATIRKTVRLAVDRGVAIGAHPSLPDLMGFGRRVMRISPQDMYDLVVYQAGAVEAFARAAGAKLHHVKCHGALYNMAAMDEGLSEAMVRAVKDLGSGVILYALSESKNFEMAKKCGHSRRRRSLRRPRLLGRRHARAARQARRHDRGPGRRR